MPKDELNRLQKAFAIFDINGDGDITHEVSGRSIQSMCNCNIITSGRFESYVM